MQMRMKLQILAPGMQDRDEADLRPQMLWIAGDILQGLLGGGKQNAINHRRVLQRNRRDLLRHGEDNMEILCVEQLGATVFKPLRA